MLLFFVLFIFFILHIQFLLQNIFLGLDEVAYFQFTINYWFNREVAIQSLFFSLACALSFAGCYKLFYRNRRRALVVTEALINLKFGRGELILVNVMGIMMIAYMSALIILAKFDYGIITQLRESNGFIFELRMVFLLLLAHIFLNVPWKQVLLLRELKSIRWIVLVYFFCTVLLQVRSAVFELVAIIVFSQLMWAGDKVKIKYIVFMLSAMLIPNLIVLGRLGIPEKPLDLIRGLFSFEYSILINNFLSTAINSGAGAVREISFISSLQLLIPSPLRDLFGLAVVKSSYYTNISNSADVQGGGFSLLAEMYSNFGWISVFVFGLLGTLVGHLNSRAARVGGVNITYSLAPLLYASFILAFRNDFGVFLKYAVQLFLIAFFLNLVFRRRLGKQHVDRLRQYRI